VFWRIRGKPPGGGGRGGRGRPGGAAGGAGAAAGEAAAVGLGDSSKRGTDNPHDLIFERIRMCTYAACLLSACLSGVLCHVFCVLVHCMLVCAYACASMRIGVCVSVYVCCA
jgi:hypothetical protein